MQEEEIFIGQQYGWWTVEKCLTPKKKGYASFWSCRCKCGRKKRISDYCLIKYKENKMDYNGCGFCELERYKNRPIICKDGVRIPVYGAWCNMKKRCNDPKHPNYKNYGGRGITVCDEWNNDFVAFYNHVTKLEHYGEEGRSLDRINNNEGYYPGNVRWATQKEQVHNSRAMKKG